MLQHHAAYMLVDHNRKTHCVAVCQPNEDISIFLPRRNDTNQGRKCGGIDPHKRLNIHVIQKS